MMQLVGGLLINYLAFLLAGGGGLYLASFSALSMASGLSGQGPNESTPVAGMYLPSGVLYIKRFLMR